MSQGATHETGVSNRKVAGALLGAGLLFALFIGVLHRRMESSPGHDGSPSREEPPTAGHVPPATAATPGATPLRREGPPPSDERLMADLRAARDPAQAVFLAQLGRTRYPTSPQTAERTVLLIEALVKLDRYPQARALAEEFVWSHPRGPLTERVERLTGAHPRRDVPRY